MQAMVDQAVERLDLINVALGKRARQSALSPWSGPSDATGAMAGDRSIRFVFHTDADAKSWWELDLREALRAWLAEQDLVVQDDPAAPYTRIGSWANTEEQRALMLDYPIEALRLREG